jgi:hypothetical protein
MNKNEFLLTFDTTSSPGRRATGIKARDSKARARVSMAREVASVPVSFFSLLVKTRPINQASIFLNLVFLNPGFAQAIATSAVSRVSAMAKFKAKVGQGKSKGTHGWVGGGLFPKGTPAVGKASSGGGKNKNKVQVKSVLSRITGGVSKGKAKTAVAGVRRAGGPPGGPGKKNDLRSRLQLGPTVTRHGGARVVRVVSAVRSPSGGGGFGFGHDARSKDLRAGLGSPGGRFGNTNTTKRTNTTKGTKGTKGTKSTGNLNTNTNTKYGDAKSTRALLKGNGNDAAGRVGDFLRNLGLGKYVSSFAKEEIDADALRELTDADLHSIGVPLGPRKKILAAKGKIRPQ